jgi:hypothetical protein
VVQVQTRRGLGSGVILNADGRIVTNAHVVGDAEQFRVTLASGKQVDATLVGRWTPGDLAVIRAQGSGLRAHRARHSSALRVGDIVMAVGNPLGAALERHAGHRQLARPDRERGRGRHDRRRDPDHRGDQPRQQRRRLRRPQRAAGGHPDARRDRPAARSSSGSAASRRRTSTRSSHGWRGWSRAAR